MKRVAAVLLCALTIGSLGQAFAQGDDHGGNCETATMVEPMSSTVGELTPNDSDFFLIQIPPGGGTLNVSTLGPTDTFGELFQLVSGIPTSVATGDNNFGDPNFFISEMVAEGTYCVQVAGRGSMPQKPYVFQVESDLPDDDHGNSCETATNVGQSMISGELSVFGDRDFFHIQVPPGGGTLTVSTLGPTDTAGELFQLVSGIPTSIATGDNNFGDPNFSISEMVEEGTYCVQVSAQRSPLGPYVFEVSGDFIPAGSCAAANVRVSVPGVNFGPVPIGRLAASPVITVTNTSAAPGTNLLIDASFLEDLNTPQFGIVNDTCAGQTLIPGAQCTVRGVFLPLSAGPKTATIMIPCNDLDSLPLEVPLSGTGVAPPPQ